MSSYQPQSYKPKPSDGRSSSSNDHYSRSNLSSSLSLPSRLDQRGPSNGAEASLRSTLKTRYDREMALKQTRIQALPPKEREEQEKWAKTQLQENAGNCSAGFDWVRIANGYRCMGGAHLVTDALLAEGRGGYLLLHGRVWGNWQERGEDEELVPLGPVYSRSEEVATMFEHYRRERERRWEERDREERRREERRRETDRQDEARHRRSYYL